MIKFLKDYWIELLTFAAIFSILMIDAAPDYSFVNKAADGIGYSYSAKYLYPSFHTSSPLYLLVSHLFIMLPSWIGSDAFRQELVSIFATTVASVFVYLVIRKLVQNGRGRALAIAGALTYGTGALVISQTTIIQTYPMATLFMICGYYFALSKKWKTMAAMIGAAFATHIITFFIFLPMFIGFREYRKWKPIVITGAFFLFFLYVPITNRPPYMWFPGPQEGNIIILQVIDTFNTITGLIGRLSIYDLPKKVFDTIGIIGVSVGVVLVVPIVYYFWKKRTWKSVLLWMGIAPPLLFISELDPNTYDYIMPGLPFLIIAGYLGMDIWLGTKSLKFAKVGKVVMYGILASVFGFASFNLIYMNVEERIDPQLSASNFYYNELKKVPNGAILLPNFDWEWEAIFKYNRDYGANIYPICKGVLPNPVYQSRLRSDGIKLTVPSDESWNFSVVNYEIAKSIVRENDNIWTTITTDPHTYGTVVVNTMRDDSLIYGIDQKRNLEIVKNLSFRWIPDNPYDIITCRIGVEKWVNVILSNYNLLMFGMLALCGAIPMYVLYMVVIRRKKWSAGKVIKSTKELSKEIG